MERDILKIKSSFVAYSVEILKNSFVSPPSGVGNKNSGGQIRVGGYIRGGVGVFLDEDGGFSWNFVSSSSSSTTAGVDSRSMNVISNWMVVDFYFIL